MTSNIHCSEDAQQIALKRLPKLISGFVEGGTGREVGVNNNTAAFDRIKLQARVLRKVDPRSTAQHFLGDEYSVPFGVAPMGMCNVVHPRADQFLAKMAITHNIPLGLSTAASTTVEEMNAIAPGRVWFQLYLVPPIDHAMSMVDRAEAAGCKTLVLTVDVPQISRRIRDLQNGFKMDFKMGPRQFFDLATHPVYSLRMALAGLPRPAHFPKAGAKFDRTASRALADWEFLQNLRGRWKGKLILKGVTSIPDAVRIKDIGADAIWVSNHGGRQLDSALAPIDILPNMRKALGSEYPLILDSGVRGGEDILKALVCGANFVMLGRPWLYAIGAEAERGLESLREAITFDLSAAMAQIGVKDFSEITDENLASLSNTVDK